MATFYCIVISIDGIRCKNWIKDRIKGIISEEFYTECQYTYVALLVFTGVSPLPLVVESLFIFSKVLFVLARLVDIEITRHKEGSMKMRGEIISNPCALQKEKLKNTMHIRVRTWGTVYTYRGVK